MKDFTYKLKEDVDVPEIVLQKADDAFARIRMEGTSQMTNKNETGKNHKNRKSAAFRRKLVAGVCICVLAAGSITAIATTRHIWDRGMQGALQATEEQKQELTEQGTAVVISEQDNYSDMSVTSGDVTVTPETVVADKRFLYMSFSVTGYDVPEGEQPGFESVNVYLGNDLEARDSDLNCYPYFYDGVISDEEGNPVYEDGSALTQDEEGNIVYHYTDQNGNLNYVITASVTDINDSLLGKTVHVDLTNLGTLQKAEYNHCLEGNWNFTISLPDTDPSEVIRTDAAVTGTDFAIKKIELSPVSIRLDYAVTGDTAAANEPDDIHGFETNSIPRFSGVILKDGTRIPYLADAGLLGYEDDTQKEAYFLSGFDRVIDVEQVASLLIMSPSTGELIEVPLS